MLCALLRRVDFWAEFIDLVGLSVLLSHDIKLLGWLATVVTYLWPRLRRIERLVSDLRTEIARFEKSTPNVFSPSLLKTLDGANANAFIGLFPERSHDAKAGSLDIYVVNAGRSIFDVEPLLFARPAGRPNSNSESPLAGPVSASLIIDRGSKQVQNTLYTVGFLIMCVSSLVAIANIAGKKN